MIKCMSGAHLVDAVLEGRPVEVHTKLS
jgi:hypothetical protein